LLQQQAHPAELAELPVAGVFREGIFGDQLLPETPVVEVIPLPGGQLAGLDGGVSGLALAQAAAGADGPKIFRTQAFIIAPKADIAFFTAKKNQREAYAKKYGESHISNFPKRRNKDKKRWASCLLFSIFPTFANKTQLLMKLLEGKVALVTGGSRGIGAAITQRFAEQGADVAFTYRSSGEQAEAVARQLSGLGAKAIAYQSDASSYQAAEELTNAVLQEFGRVDILVNNAGITRDNLMLRMTEEMWDEVIQANLKSIFNLTKHLIRHMMKNRGGSIINMSSIVGMTGNAGQANYAASKAGIIGFTKSVAKEMGSRNIRCNAIAPGFIETDMTDALDEKVKEGYLANIPMKRLGKAEEVADVCVFLGSDLSAYVSGQVISVCGALNT